MSVTHSFSRLTLGISAAALLAGSLLASPAMASEKIRWQVPLAFPSHLVGLTTPVKHLSESLKAISGATSSCATTSRASWCRPSRS